MINLEGLLIVGRYYVARIFGLLRRLPVRALYIVALITRLMRNISIYVGVIVRVVVLHAMIVLLIVALVNRRARGTRSLIILGVLILGLMRWTLETRGRVLLGVNVLAFGLVRVMLVVLTAAVDMLRTHHGVSRAMVAQLLIRVRGTLEAGLHCGAHVVWTLHARMLRAVVGRGAGTGVPLLHLRLLRHWVIIALLVAVVLLVMRMHPLLWIAVIVLLRDGLLVLMVV